MKNLPFSAQPRLRRDFWLRTIEFVQAQRPDVAMTLIFLETEEFQLAATCSSEGVSGHIDGTPYLGEQFAALLFAAQDAFEISLMAAADPQDLASVIQAAKLREELRNFIQQVRAVITV